MFAIKPTVMLAAIAAFAFVAITNQASVLAAGQEIVEFRLTKWKSIHFDDTQKAKVHHDTFKKLQCEVQQHSHDGHIDVTYRCPKWKSLALKTHDQAHKWEHWLKASGFETRHKH